MPFIENLLQVLIRGEEFLFFFLNVIFIVESSAYVFPSPPPLTFGSPNNFLKMKWFV